METLPRLRVIHVDDDARCLHDLKAYIGEIKTIEYLGGFVSADDGLEFVKNKKVDLAFVDIEMPVHDGLWFAKQILKEPIDVIFLTAHTGYALKAFEVCALDYLVKPINLPVLVSMLKKSYTYKRKTKPMIRHAQIASFQEFIDIRAKPERIFINTVGEVLLVNLDEVIYLSAAKNYTIVVLKNGERKTSSKAIRMYAATLVKNTDFVRVHRSYMVNKNYVKKIIRNSETRQILLIMENGEGVETSFKTKEEAMERLG